MPDRPDWGARSKRPAAATKISKEAALAYASAAPAWSPGLATIQMPRPALGMRTWPDGEFKLRLLAWFERQLANEWARLAVGLRTARAEARRDGQADQARLELAPGGGCGMTNFASGPSCSVRAHARQLSKVLLASRLKLYCSVIGGIL